MSQTDTTISSTISFETNGTSAWSKILHTIANNIQVDGLKVKRITIFEQPLLARIYIKDMAIEALNGKRVLDAFRPKVDQDIHDYVVCVELRERPLFKAACSYKIEQCVDLNDIKASAKIEISNRFKDIISLLSKSILKSLTHAGGRNFEACNLSS